MCDCKKFSQLPGEPGEIWETCFTLVWSKDQTGLFRASHIFPRIRLHILTARKEGRVGADPSSRHQSPFLYTRLHPLTSSLRNEYSRGSFCAPLEDIFGINCGYWVHRSNWVWAPYRKGPHFVCFNGCFTQFIVCIHWCLANVCWVKL